MPGLTNRPELECEHYEAARDLLEARVDALPGDSRARSSLGIVDADLGRREDAIHEGNLGLELLGGSLNTCLGWRLKDLDPIDAMVRDDDQAIDQLEQLLSVPAWFSVGFHQIDPTWDPLREHPRFQALLDEYS